MKLKDSTIEVELGQFVPKYIAQKCVVCLGYGSFSYGTRICQACNGTGYIKIPTKEPEPAGLAETNTSDEL